MIIRPAKYLRGEIKLPGDKSISHRAAIIAAMAEGETRIDNFATSADCASTLRCLRQLGVQIRQEGTTVWVCGVGKAGFKKPNGPLDCGNSGTTMRLLAGVLAGQDFESVLIGDESLMKRPMRRLIEPLTAMGAIIDSDNGRAPLKIRGRSPLRAIEYSLPVASAQIKSCVLLAGLNADGRTSVIEPVQTRDHTERMLRWFGVDVFAEGGLVSVSGESRLTARPLSVPSDISSAAFFLVAAAMLQGSDLVLPNVGINSSRIAVIDVLRKLGAEIEIANPHEMNNESVGDMRVKGGLQLPAEVAVIEGAVIANLIDELPILAILGTQLPEGLMVRDAAELRVKETDRIAAVCDNLRRMGADVEEFEDGFRVGKSRLKGARVDSFGDHRIAMAFAVAGLIAGDTEIVGAECVDVSFPGFFEALNDVVVY